MVDQVVEKRHRVLVVDDDREMRAAIKLMLDRKGYIVAGAKSVSEAISLIQDTTKNIKLVYDIILIDVRLEDKSGLEVLQYARSVQAKAQVIMISGDFDN